MSWQKLILRTTSNAEDELSELLTDAGAVAVTLEDAEDQPLLEPAVGETPLWEQILVIGLFEDKIDINAVIARLPPEKIIQQRLEYLPEQDWQRTYQDTFKPICFADRLWICPSWSDLPDPSAVTVMLDPGLAFGTGSHPTTSLCLKWLAENLSAGQTVIDYGCGSGILAIAALKLGAKKVWAIDNDPQALEATLENSRRNQLSIDQLDTLMPEQCPELQANVLIANILAKPLIELAPLFARLVKPKGKLVLSGILEAQAEVVIKAYKAEFHTIEKTIQEEWVRLSATRKWRN